MVAGNPCYSGPPPSLPERTTSAATQYVKPRTGVPQAIVPPQPGEQVRITVGSCYGPESPLPQVGGNIIYPRPRRGVEPEPPAPVNQLQITVGNCYIPGEPPRVVVPQEAGSPAVSTPRPRQGTLITPPAAQPGDLVRSIVDNCYDGQPVTLKPDPGPYLPRPKKEIDLEPIPPNGSDVIRDLVGQCYGPIGPFLEPDDGPNYPRPRKGPQDDPEYTEPGAVIREIVQRCYPEIVPSPQPPPDDVDPRDPIPIFPDPPPWEWLCELFPYLPICELNPGPIVPPQPPYGPPSIGDGEDCQEVELGKLAGTLKRYKYPEIQHQWIYIKGPNKGKILICNTGDIPENPDTEWEKCVKNYLDCLFKPYATGTYRSPPADCDTFYFRGQNSVTKKICVANCYPERIPIYEYKTAGVPNVMVTPVADALGNGSGSFVKHNLRIQTTDVAGNYTGGKVFCEAGNKYFNSATTFTENVSVGGATVQVKIQSVADGGEFDSRWWVQSFSGSLPAIGTEVEHTFNAGKRDLTFKVEVIEAGGSTSDHRYGLTSQPDKGGYTTTNQGEPAFYILKDRVKGSVPLFRSFSETTQDTFLTINPGAPDSKGPGERATMDAAGQVLDRVLGYVFPNKDLASGKLLEGERIQELHRYYNGGKAEINATFNSSGNIVVGGNGSGQLKINVQWDDNPGTAGVSFNTINFGQGQTVTREGEKGSKGVSLNVTAGQTISVNYTGLQGLSVQDNGKKLCLRDGHGTDCNASLFIGGTKPGPSTATDHKYSIVKMQGSMTPPKFDNKRQAYVIPSDADVPFTIQYSVKRGAAGYENSWGVCICDRDGGTIHWARVIEANTTRDIEYTQYTIPVSTLKQYAGKDIVFFLIPDGNQNGVPSSGSSISFSSNGNAYQHPSSTENNWVFFANQKMNPDQRNKVKFHGPGEQWWEDLHGSDSDEDYDDFKLLYRVAHPGSTWKYEGIECYVYDQPAPAPTLIDIIVRDQCSEPLFNKAFEQGMVMRSKCGPKTPPNKHTEKSKSDSGKCRGEYAHEFYRSQTVRCRRSANLSLKAFGLLIRSVESEEIRFRFKLKKNGSTIINYDGPIGAWPQIGHNFGDFSVAKGDRLKFEIDDIERGPSAGISTVSWIIFDRDDQVFEKPWQYDIGTTPITGEAMGRTEVTSNEPRIGDYTGPNISSGGRIKRLSIRLWDRPRRQWTDKVYVWDQGQLDTNANLTNGQSVEWNDIYYDGQEWADNQGYNGGFYERNANRRGHVLSSNIDGDGKFSGNPNIRDGRGIFYNALFEYGRGLICKPVLDNDNLRTYVHMSNTHGFMAWYTQFKSGSVSNFNSAMQVIDNYYATGINTTSSGTYPQGLMVSANGQYSKMSFMHDYKLGEYGAKQNSTDSGGSGKIRVAFWPYTVMPSHKPAGTPRYSNSIYWACGVEIMDVLNEGYAYGVGQTFDLHWPPIQNESDDYQDLVGSTTPYFPRDSGASILPGHPDKLPKKIRVQTLGEDPDDRFNNSYSPKEVFYQESHNRSSNIWYLCQKKKDRVKFRIEIEEVY